MKSEEAIEIMERYVNCKTMTRNTIEALSLGIEAIKYMDRSFENAKATSEVVIDFESEWQRQLEINHVLSKENEELKQALIKVVMKL